MCGRYTLAGTTPDQLRERFPLGESVEIRQRFNVAPADDVLAVVMRDGAPTGALLRWGLVPPWAESPSVGFKLINARAETVAEKPAYRDAFNRRRCLVIADGFYEWERDGGTAAGGGGRRPFHVQRAGGEPFAFAAIGSVWKDPQGEWLRSCAIVTTTANDLIAPIHPRMPVILDPDDEATWLDPETPPEHAQQLLRPLPVSLTHARPVSKAVNDARYDGPDCLLPAEPEPEQVELF
jgi:putative SOS response-associated peptidase YedK